jgi:O-6-methylguanine DNA methyltransferase
MPEYFQQLDISTSWGVIKTELVAGKVVSCTLPFLSETPKTPLTIISNSDDPVSRFIASVLTGQKAKRPSFEVLKGTAFQKSVWDSIARIPKGSTISYGALAQEIGKPKAVRAIGSACGRNPLPLFIPCHRVKAAHGALGGFSAGLPWKTYLLKIEQ